MKSPPLPVGESGSGKGPVVWLLLRAFCLLMLLTQGLVVAFFIMGVVAPEWTDDSLRYHPEQLGAVKFFCFLFSLIFGLPLLAMVPSLVVPRSRFGWYLGAVSLWGGIFTTCGWPLAIPLVVFWYHPDVQRYSGWEKGEKRA